MPIRHCAKQDMDEHEGALKATADMRSRKSGGARRDRTDDLMLAKHALSQLSYGPKPKGRSDQRMRLVGLGRLELPTSRLSSARSNQLSYKPEPLACDAYE